eukprot:TRINITY_DN66948_c0_g1_i1.p1 TRINITY_DN66948_c0_g1~~TRINITY_DN66948_c0_g1_i1.p1  ORF type:complete len:380 (-),score=70.96 TRINITY_DN66948_c0_g1_i1:24-1163(-)
MESAISLGLMNSENARPLVSGTAQLDSQSTGRSSMPRLLDRQNCFKQSAGRLKIRRTHTTDTMQLRMQDPFHTLVDLNTPTVMLLVSSFIVISWLVFALLFLATSQWCDTEVDSFIKALYLAIETVETIGYGVPDPSFNSCYSAVFVLGASALTASLMNAMLISVVYTRMSRATSRATAIVFSEKAVVVQIEGLWYFMFQICDFRKHQLCEAHMRCYSIQHAPTESGVHYQTRAMRLQHPDDELGGMLLLAIPQLVVHRIDACSALFPQCEGQEAFPRALPRASEMERDTGEAVLREQIEDHLAKTQVEILCVVEGIEASSSMTLQARHSYTADDIVFNASFKQCVAKAPDGTCEVNFDVFHELEALATEKNMFVQSMP